MRLSSILPTLTATGMAMAAPAKREPSGDFKGQMLDAHNFFRKQHSADPLVWDDKLATKALNWAKGCQWGHSGSGENLARSTGSKNWGDFANMWGEERKSYNFDNGGFSSGTGHFTQVVWKDTKKVGCGQWSECSGLGVYVVCNYDPPGNYNNDYAKNVGKLIDGADINSVWKPGQGPDKEPPKEPEQPPKEPEQPPKEPEQPPKEPEEPEDGCENEEGDPEWNQDSNQEGNQDGNQDGNQEGNQEWDWNHNHWQDQDWDHNDWNNKDWNHNDWSHKDWSKYWNKE